MRNEGSLDLSVESLDFDSSSGELRMEGDPLRNLGEPPTLAPGKTARIGGDYEPIDELGDTAVLSLVSNDPAAPQVDLSMAFTGAFEPDWHAIERHEVLPPAQADVVITFSRAESMEPWRATVRGELQDLAQALVTLPEGDVRLGVVVDDSGCVVGSPAWTGPPASAKAAEDAVLEMADLDQSLSLAIVDTEAPFLLARRALEEAEDGGRNEGLVRTHTGPLHLVHLTASPESSPYEASDQQTWLKEPRTLDGSLQDTVVHAIQGASSCGSEQDPELHDLASWTGGITHPVCEEGWAADLVEAVESSLDYDPTRFVLQEYPVVETVTVTVEGQEIEGWTSEDYGKVVVFEPEALPEAGSVMEISYEPKYH